MKYSTVLIFALGFTLGNLFYQGMTDKNWFLAFDRSFFQFTALTFYWFFNS